MKLLKEKELKWSAVVANCNMNRKRNLNGVNSYEKDIQFDIIEYLKKQINKNKKASWIDLCCGEGKAIIQASEVFKGLGMKNKVALEGIDLVDMFEEFNPENKIKFTVKSLVAWLPEKKYDLITCVHGLHYIGDKLLVIKKAVSVLKNTGVFIANIDLENIKNQKNILLKNELIQQFKELNIKYNSRKKILICEGHRKLQFNYIYLGADDKAGKNYTGQEVVNSFYEKK